jgi:hypothetical protein
MLLSLTILCFRLYLSGRNFLLHDVLLSRLIFLPRIVESVFTVITWMALYSRTVTHYGQPDTIGDVSWPVAIPVPLIGLIGSTVQSFFAWRIRVLSGHLIIPIISWTGAIIHFGFGIALAVAIMRCDTLSIFLFRYEWLVTTQFTLDVVLDMLNTISLCYYLTRRRSAFKE